MKKAFRSYFSFSRTERLGFFALSVLLLALLTVRLTMHYFVHPHIDIQKQEQFSAAWKNFKEQQTEQKQDTTETTHTIATTYPAIININTADSETLISLDGIGPATAHKIIQRRKEKGPFTSKKQLLEIPRFPKKNFEILKKMISTGNE